MLSRLPGFLLSRFFLPSILGLAVTPYAFTQGLTGTVTNGTSGRVAAGVDVTLIKLAQGMQEADSTKTDSKGNFSFKMDDAGGPHLVRATFQGATYFKAAPPGTSSVELTIYDSAAKVEGLSYTVEVLKLQTEKNQLNGTRLFVINNQSKPPRTQMSDATFEFYLPEGAQIDATMARAPNGNPVKAAVEQRKERNLYAFNFPLRPGETQLQIGFHTSYSGSAEINPKSKYPLEHFVVMLPKSMKFDPMGTPFQSIQDGPGAGSANVQVVTQTQPGKQLTFKISGSGTLPEEGEGGEAQASGASGPGNSGPTGQGMSSRPGGGLGPPSDAPDPLENFKWWILLGFGIVLVGGGVYVTLRNKKASAMAGTPGMSVPASFAADVYSAPIQKIRASNPPPAAASTATSAPAESPSLLMQAMKEELFQLEVDRQQGRISMEEYTGAKAALDQTLARAIQRESRKN
jgi:hypothetical protein